MRAITVIRSNGAMAWERENLWHVFSIVNMAYLLCWEMVESIVFVNGTRDET
jgi:hypothetical protein